MVKHFLKSLPLKVFFGHVVQPGLLLEALELLGWVLDGGVPEGISICLLRPFTSSIKVRRSCSVDKILGVGCKLNRVEAKVDDYDELGDSMTRWKDVAWFWLSRKGDEDGQDLESKINDVMVTRSLQGGDGAACNVWVKFTSQSDIDVFSMSIKEGKYADILSTMSTTDIDTVVNAIETIGKKFLDEVNKATGTQLRSSPMMNNSSPLVSSSTTISVPCELNNIDVTATFGVPLTTVGDLHKLINDIKVGKHDELLSGLTNDDRIETLDALGYIFNLIQANRNNAYVTPCKVLHADDSINLNIDESTIPSDPIVQFMNVNTKSTSYAGAAGASAKDQPNVNSNFHTLVADPVFDGVNVSIPRKVFEKVSTRLEHTLYGYFIGNRMVFLLVEYYARSNWAKHRLKRIMMNSKGFFLFKFDSRAGLEVVLEGGPWLIRKSPIIIKKWSMDTRLLKEELTRIPIWVKLHDVPI
ncbi:zinc knuckle CX2CX4HX4C containing protein [Tanacetum coccineum]